MARVCYETPNADQVIYVAMFADNVPFEGELCGPRPEFPHVTFAFKQLPHALLPYIGKTAEIVLDGYGEYVVDGKVKNQGYHVALPDDLKKVFEEVNNGTAHITIANTTDSKPFFTGLIDQYKEIKPIHIKVRMGCFVRN